MSEAMGELTNLRTLNGGINATDNPSSAAEPDTGHLQAACGTN